MLSSNKITICSSVKITYGIEARFFTMLGNDGTKWLESVLIVYDDDKPKFLHWRWSNKTLPILIANTWMSSCMAIDSETGLLQWVVDGTLVENTTLMQLKDANNKPSDLTGKIVLGGWYRSSSKDWRMTSNQVTNLNIFSTALTIGEMQENTIQGNCAAEGDYLAWSEMQWKLEGEARKESVEKSEICLGHPSFNLYDALYYGMKSCRGFCMKLGGRLSRAAKSFIARFGIWCA